MGLQVTDIVARCLAYLSKTTADTLPTGATVWLVDAIQGALGEMRDAAPGLFRKKTGGILLAKATQSVTLTQGAGITLTTTVGNLNTARFPGGMSDYTIQAVSGTSASIVPAWEGAGVAVTATIWNDAWEASDGAAFSDCEITAVRVNGQPVEKVASREAAESRWGVAANWGMNVPSARAECGTGDLPRYWWVERYAKKTYVCLYPMPTARANIEAELVLGWSDIAAADVVASTATFDLPDDVAREIWRPLAILRWSAAPLFANESAKVEIERQAVLARARLAAMAPKKRCAPAFGSAPIPVPME